MADVFVMPDDWKFYQCDLGFGEHTFVSVAGEPHGSVAIPTITLDVTSKGGFATIYLDASEASEIWTTLGHAIATASGKPPVPATFIDRNGDRTAPVRAVEPS